MNTEILCVSQRKPANPSWNILRHHHVSGLLENGLKGGSTFEAKCGVAAAFSLLRSCSLSLLLLFILYWFDTKTNMNWEAVRVSSWVKSMQWSSGGVKWFDASKCQITSVGAFRKQIRKICRCVCVWKKDRQKERERKGEKEGSIVLWQPWRESSRATLAGEANVLFCSQWTCHRCTAGPSENKSGCLSSG